MNVPKLRFKEFTDVWKEYPLKYFTTPIKRKNINNESDLPLTISSLDGLVDQRTYFNKVVASKDMSNYYLLKKGEFAYNKSYSVGFPFGSIKRLDKYNQGALSSLYICFQVNNMNSDFIVKYFESPQWHKQISLCVAEGARNHGLLNVNINDFFSTKHFLPQLAEQEKIANFLAIVDKKIINLENTITNLENQKKGLLQQIFSQKLRFKDKNGNNYPNWKKKKLGDLFTIKAGGDINKENFSEQYSIEFKYPVYANALTNNGLYGYSNIYKIDKPSITVTGRGINVGFALSREPFYYPIVRLLVLIPNININFTFFTESINFIHIFNESTGVPQLTAPQLSKVNVYVPNIEEQNKIGNLFDKLNEKIDNKKAQLEHWQQIKKGLLQQMFV